MKVDTNILNAKLVFSNQIIEGGVSGFKIVSRASKVGISLDEEVVFTEGYSVVSVDGWKDLFRELT